MTERRQRMIACLQLRGLSERTQDMDVRAVRQLAEPSRKSPDVSTEEALRPAFLSITPITHDSRRASTIARCGITCVFAPPRHRDWTTRRVVRAPREQKLPVILSLEEVRRLLGCVPRPRARVCLSTIDPCGRRLQEGTPLQVREIARARVRIHVRHGKGGNDRDCPLATPHAGTAAPVLGDASPSRLDRPGAGSRRDLAVDHHTPEAQEPCAGSMPGSPQRQWPPHTRGGAHAAAFLGHPCARGWPPSPAHARVSRTPRSHHHTRRHAPDGQSGTPRRGRHHPPHGGSVLGESAEIFRLQGPASRATCGDRRLPSHRRAMQDMERGRPETLGGQGSHGETCRESQARDHSWKNRHGPTCQQDQGEPWRDHHTRLRRPVPHVMGPVTLPAALRALARRHQKTLDHLLLRRSSEA